MGEKKCCCACRSTISSGTRGRGCLLALLALAGMLGARDAGAQAITRFVRDTGKINFVTTGGALRNSATNTFALNATSTRTLSGIPAGTTIEVSGWFDNSPNNPHNPDPSATVRFGEQSWEEMMLGFYDIVIPADKSLRDFFTPSRQAGNTGGGQ